MNLDFNNKNVFVTGGSRGIGKCICDAFSKNGANVISPSRTEMNLSSSDSVNTYLDLFNQTNPDILVFCAGINNKALAEDVTVENMLETFQINVTSSIQIIKKFVGNLKNNRNGKIIFVSSLYATVSKEGRIPYASSKNALTGLMKTLALELAPYDICVNAVAPGYVMTEMTYKNLNEKEIEEIKSMIPTHRFQEPEEIADIILYLCSDNNKSITGQLISVDGGFLCR